QRKMLIGRVLGQLGQHWFFAHGRRLRCERRQQRRHVVEDDSPIAGFALAGDSAPKTGRRLVLAEFAEIKFSFLGRGHQWEQRQSAEQLSSHIRRYIPLPLRLPLPLPLVAYLATILLPRLCLSP